MARGSEWQKCDLHIHTPLSIEQHYGDRNSAEVWENFISDLEKEDNYPNGSIIGISDYYFLDGYHKVSEYKNNGRLKNISKIFPLIELRLKEFGGHNSVISRVNMHVLFNPDKYNTEQIKNQFICAISTNYKLNPMYDNNKQVVWDGCITKESLETLGKKIKETVNPSELSKFKSDFIEGFNNLNISLEQVNAVLNKDFFRNNVLTMVGKTEWKDIKWSDNSIADKKNIVNSIHFIFNSYDNIENFKNDYEYQTQSQVNNRLLDCSDAHYLSSSIEKDKIGKCCTWIKGNPCFETIRQAFFSYDTRIKISKDKPTQAVNTIDKIKIFLPPAAKIGDNDLCFSGMEYNLELNPALNCFIGGRGTGKSLLLQLFCKHNQNYLPEVDTKDKTITKNIVSKIKDWDKYIDIDGIEFEYFGQGTIEGCYEDKEIFKESISKRLYQFWETEEDPSVSKSLLEIINENKIKLQEIIDKIEKEINIVESKIRNDNEITKIQKEVITRQKIVETFKDKEYIELQKNIAEISKKVSFIDSTKSLLTSLLDKISVISNESQPVDINGNEEVAYYAKEYNILLNTFSNYTKGDSNPDRETWIEKEKNLRLELKLKEELLKNYLNKRGMSKNNIQDAMKAQKELNDFETKIKNLNNENEKEEQNINNLRSSVIENNKTYQNIMENILDMSKNALVAKENSKEVAFLKFKYNYDLKLSLNDLFGFIKQNTGIDSIGDFKSILDRRDETVKKEDLTADVLTQLCNNHSKNLKSCQKILDYFDANSRNKKLYDLKYLLCRYNGIKYENFIIYYKDKKLEDLSFGQRATAIVLTMIIFGNKPLIIDEPETHLDQRVIASELVNVIKNIKTDKQIIFATHNANIVINADAEQIYILRTEPDNKTSFTQMSIEDVYQSDKKNELLMLEGSLEAFKQREHKYSI